MSLALSHEAGNIYRMDIRGLLLKTDLEHGETLLAHAIGEHGPIRLLVVVGQFTGWEGGLPSDDMEFYQSYGDHIDRIAIVGHDRWREPMMMFATAGLRRAPVDFFVPGAIAQARAWLAQRPVPVERAEERAGPYGEG